MASARCPICNDVFTIGVAVKLNQALICPTCLANLEVVSLTPLELEPAVRANPLSLDRLKKNRNGRRKSSPSALGDIDEFYDEIIDFDDYTLERRLRYKSEREKRRSSSERP